MSRPRDPLTLGRGVRVLSGFVVGSEALDARLVGTLFEDHQEVLYLGWAHGSSDLRLNVSAELSVGEQPQERLGHATISITMDIYSHAIPAMQEDAADRVAALVRLPIDADGS